MASGGVSRVVGSDYVYEYVCNLCELDGKEIEATGWCQNCQDYLCASCYAHHLKPKPSRDHVLLDKNSMPKHASCDLCELEGKSVDATGYCTDCEDFLCSPCFNNHLKPKPSRHHILLDKKHMPRSKQQLKGGNPARASTTSQVAGSRSNPVSKTQITRRSVDAGKEPPLGRDARKFRAEHVCDIDVKMKDDDCWPHISGCVVLPGNKLAIVDYYDRVKLIDLVHNTLVGNIQLSGPWDITRMSDTQVAVTSWKNQTIYFLNVSKGLKKVTSVNVNGECRGIACANDRLVVSYTDPVKVEMLSMDGRVLQVVVSEHKARELFAQPWYVEVSRDKKSLYITDVGKNTVTKLTLAGDVISTFQSGELKAPLGLAVDKTGAVYVCGRDSHTLVQLTAELTQPRRLLQESDGLYWPWSVCYDEATDTLYIGMYESVKVFQLK